MRKAYVYALFVVLNDRPRYFYVGATHGNPNRMWEHGVKSTSAITPRRFIRIMKLAGVEIQRLKLAWYSPETVYDWEQYWWDALIRRGHPLQNERPMDATKARIKRWNQCPIGPERDKFKQKMRSVANPAKARQATTTEQRKLWGLMGGRYPGGQYRSEAHA